MSRTPVRLRFALSFMAFLSLMLVASARADTVSPLSPQSTSLMRPGDLTMQFLGTETGSFSSNPLLSTTGAKSLWGSTTSPELMLKDSTDSSVLSVDGIVDRNQFNQANFNSTDGHLSPSMSFKNERWNTSLAGSANYDTTRTSEITNYGLTPSISRHLGFSVAPQIGFTPTARDAFALSGSALSSHYDSNLFVNYETFSATPSYTHSFTERQAAILTVEAQRYRALNSSKTQVDSVGPLLGWQTTVNPRFTLNASAGAQANRQYEFGSAVTGWTWHYIYAAGLSFKGQQDTIAVNASRAQNPYGNGTEALQTTLGFTEAHSLNDNLSLNLGASYISSDYQVSTAGNIDYLLSGTAGVTYHATEQLDVGINYQYRYETLTGESATAQDNSGTLNLTYHPKMWTLM